MRTTRCSSTDRALCESGGASRKRRHFGKASPPRAGLLSYIWKSAEQGLREKHGISAANGLCKFRPRSGDHRRLGDGGIGADGVVLPARQPESCPVCGTDAAYGGRAISKAELSSADCDCARDLAAG